MKRDTNLYAHVFYQLLVSPASVVGSLTNRSWKLQPVSDSFSDLCYKLAKIFLSIHFVFIFCNHAHHCHKKNTNAREIVNLVQISTKSWIAPKYFSVLVQTAKQGYITMNSFCFECLVAVNLFNRWSIDVGLVQELCLASVL